MSERQKCAVQICPAVARRTVLQERYCEACAKAVEQSAYMLSLPQKAAEHVRYRLALVTEPPEGVELPEPLAAPPVPPRTGWKSRR